MVAHLLHITATDYKLNDAKIKRLIDRFVDQLFEQHDTRDEGCQTYETGEFLSEDAHNLVASTVADITQNVGILNDCVQEMAQRMEELRNDNATLLEKSQAMIEFHEAQSTQLQALLQKCDEMLQMQVYSSTMNENLINDLLDLAKLENGSVCTWSRSTSWRPSRLHSTSSTIWQRNGASR